MRTTYILLCFIFGEHIVPQAEEGGISKGSKSDLSAQKKKKNAL